MKFFVSRVKTNLRILICLPPSHPLLESAPSHYPGLLTGCQLIWMCDWPQESLKCEASYYVDKNDLTKDCDQDIRYIRNIGSVWSEFCPQLLKQKWTIASIGSSLLLSIHWLQLTPEKI